jgi:ribonuclease J
LKGDANVKFIKPNETAVFALGGLGEVGKNTYCIQHKNEIIVIDAGVMFPSDELLGIDYVIPDISYLIKNQDKIKAVIITHGHEDHIGGLPFMLRQISFPELYAPKLAMGLINNKLDDRAVGYHGEKKILDESTNVKTKYFDITFFRTNHSIPDSYGIALKTPNGTIIHTGDFKFDFTPIGEPADLGRMAELGNEGVKLLLSDSTNAEQPGMTMSERKVDHALGEIFRRTKSRIIIATFASNVHRLKHIIETARQNGRKVAIYGRSMESAIRIAVQEKFIDVDEDTFADNREVRGIDPSKLTILCTGSQGEPLAALSRIAAGTHRNISLAPGDTVIFSSSPIPGNAAGVGKTINKLYRQGANVITNALEPVHTSGHAQQEELKLMLRLTRPEYFMPIHGEYRMLKVHAGLGIETGVKKENTFVCQNGDVVAIGPEGARKAGQIRASDIYVDGKGIGDIGNIVIRDRKILSNNGIIVVAASIDMKNRKLLAIPNVQTRGFIHVKENEKLMREIIKVSNDIVSQKLANRKPSFTELKNEISEKLANFVFEKTTRRPMVLPVIMDVKKAETAPNQAKTDK